jgi:hypothetical protein
MATHKKKRGISKNQSLLSNAKYLCVNFYMENKFCQSCGMPLKKDPAGGGTNADGSLSKTYCSYCYQQGEFSFTGSVAEFQDFCKHKMIESGHNRFVSWLLTRGMSRLARWKQS